MTVPSEGPNVARLHIKLFIKIVMDVNIFPVKSLNFAFKKEKTHFKKNGDPEKNQIIAYLFTKAGHCRICNGKKIMHERLKVTYNTEVTETPHVSYQKPCSKPQTRLILGLILIRKIPPPGHLHREGYYGWPEYGEGVAAVGSCCNV